MRERSTDNGFDPTSVNEQWAIRPEPYDAANDFTAASERGDVQAWLQALAPRHSAYVSLLAQHRKYRDIVAAGGWPSMNVGTLFRERAHMDVSGTRLRKPTVSAAATAEATATTP